MKKRCLTFIACCFYFVLQAQLIQNGNFETLNPALTGNMVGNVSPATGWVNGCSTWDGNPGTPDLVSTTISNGFLSVPLDGRILQRNNGQVNKTFVGMMGGPANATNPPGHRESIIGTITEALSADYEYTVGLWVAASKLPSLPDPIFKVEVLLRKPNNCTDSKLVYTSGNVPLLNNSSSNPTSNWTQFSGTFTLTPQEVNQGYSRLEIRLNGQSTSTRVGIDDVTLTKRELPKAAFNFVTIGQTYSSVSTPYGPIDLVEICAAPSPQKTTVLINGGASQFENSYGIKIQAWNPQNWIPLNGAAPIYDAWISNTAVPANDININNLPGVNMVHGTTYLVTLYVGTPYHSVNRLVRINVLPALNPGSDQTVCAGTTASVNVTSNVWPVKVYKGTTLIGSYNSSPIVFTPSTSGAYTFTASTASNCSASDIVNFTVNTCSLSSFVFKHPLGTEQVDSYYGPQTVYQSCSPYEIDGSASTNENEYHLYIAHFDLDNWVVGSEGILYEDWYGVGQVGNDIDLATVVLPNTFTYGEIYIVALSVGPQWNSMTKFLRAIDCRKSGEVTLELFDPMIEQSSFSVSPNPFNGKVTAEFGGIQANKITVINVIGETIIEQSINSKTTSTELDLSNLQSGTYIISLEAGNEKFYSRIIKN